MKLNESEVKELAEAIKTRYLDEEGEWYENAAQAAADWFNTRFFGEPSDEQVEELAKKLYSAHWPHIPRDNPEVLTESARRSWRKTARAAYSHIPHRPAVDREKLIEDFQRILEVKTVWPPEIAHIARKLLMEKVEAIADHALNIFGAQPDAELLGASFAKEQALAANAKLIVENKRLREENEALKAELDANRGDLIRWKSEQPDTATIVSEAVERYIAERYPPRGSIGPITKAAYDQKDRELRTFSDWYASSLQPAALKPCPEPLLVEEISSIKARLDALENKHAVYGSGAISFVP